MMKRELFAETDRSFNTFTPFCLYCFSVFFLTRHFRFFVLILNTHTHTHTKYNRKGSGGGVNYLYYRSATTKTPEPTNLQSHIWETNKNDVITAWNMQLRLLWRQSRRRKVIDRRERLSNKTGESYAIQNINWAQFSFCVSTIECKCRCASLTLSMLFKRVVLGRVRHSESKWTQGNRRAGARQWRNSTSVAAIYFAWIHHTYIRSRVAPIDAQPFKMWRLVLLWSLHRRNLKQTRHSFSTVGPYFLESQRVGNIFRKMWLVFLSY